ncbi:MAG TPA: ATP synthase F1 subunit epsilon [Fibrobacteraceae bacterium]|nr:ATP synthase F1 subunit epsilon [Fibrobacteraceae bacterium]
MQLRVISPEKVLLQAEAQEVQLDTQGGQLGILDHHAPLVGTLKPGVIRAKVAGNWQEIPAQSGLVEVSHNQVTVLVEI